MTTNNGHQAVESAAEGSAQEQLPQTTPLVPPSLKNMAALLNAMERIYPYGDFSGVYQWTRFVEVCEAAFHGGIRFVVLLIEWNAEREAERAAADSGDQASAESAAAVSGRLCIYAGRVPPSKENAIDS